MKKNGYKAKGHLRLISLGVCLAVLLLSLSSCWLSDLFRRDALSKEELYENMREDGGYTSVAEYLYKWEFPTFNADKLLAVEDCVRQNYCNDLPKTYDHARACAAAFLASYYDKTDLHNKNAVTDALIHCYTAAIGDPFAVYRNASAYSDFSDEMSGGSEYVGIGVRLRESAEGYPFVISVIPDSPAEAAGIGSGDIIVAVEGVRAEKNNYKELVNSLSGKVGTSVSLTVLKDGTEHTLSVQRREVVAATVTSRMDGTVGIVEILSFKESTVDEFKSAVNELLSNGADGLIFDLRNNLGGILSVVVDMIAYLAEDGLPVVSYTYKNAQKTLLDTGRDGHSVDVPMVVVVNEYTASAAEIFAAALRDYELMGEQINVTTVGKTTFGKGVMQRVYTFADGSAITFTVAYYDPPLGENYHGVGVVPDISVNDSVSLTGGDAQMGAAIDAMRRMLFAA